jgi:hypothetical protein
MEQQFELIKISKELENVDRDRVVQLLLQTVTTLMMKDNIIRDLVKEMHSNFGALP